MKSFTIICGKHYITEEVYFSALHRPLQQSSSTSRCRPFVSPDTTHVYGQPRPSSSRHAIVSETDKLPSAGITAYKSRLLSHSTYCHIATAKKHRRGKWPASQPEDCIARVLSKSSPGNLDFSRPYPAVRASAALAHIKHVFGGDPNRLVMMLQELRSESLQAVLEHEWVQQNFAVSNVEPPQSLVETGQDGSDISREIKWRATHYFTLVMVSKTLPISNCFRVPFVTRMGRDALVVDIPLLGPGQPSTPGEAIRLCATHLESLWEGKAYRLDQMAQISALLKGIISFGRTDHRRRGRGRLRRDRPERT